MAAGPIPDEAPVTTATRSANTVISHSPDEGQRVSCSVWC
jgi:hypothetical protein